jgi:dTDP-4-dehydrorhamnose reductase
MSGIYIVGQGHLGKILTKELGDLVCGTWSKEMDDLSIDELKKQNHDVVVCCAGKTELAWCEANPLETFRCNVSAPLGLFRRVSSLGKTFINISSGCIWDGPYGEDGEPFGPDAPATPAAFYSWTKACCDALMMRDPSPGGLFILRPRQVYSCEDAPRNALMKIRGYESLIENHNSMTSAYTIAKTIKVLHQRLYSAPTKETIERRILSVYDRGVFSPFKMGVILAETGLRDMPKKMTKTDLDGWLSPRRVDAVMKDELFEEWVNPPEVEDEVRRVVSLIPGANA